MPYFSNGEAKSKLVILHTLKYAGMDLSRMQLYRIVFETDAMSYFDFQNALYELELSKYIALVPRAFGQSYRLSANGENALKSLEETVADSAFEKIEKYIKDNREAMLSETKYPVEEEQLPDGTYKIHMSVQENDGSIFEISLNVDNHEMAQKIRRKWESESTEIFQEILNHLL